MPIFSNFKEKILSIFQNLVENYIYEMRYGQVKIKRKGGLGFIGIVCRNQTPEEIFLTSIDYKGRTVYDIGGYIGILSIFFSKSSGSTGKVIVFEPNEENCCKIQEHIRLNEVHNVKLLKFGIGDTKNEDQIFIVRRKDSATGSMVENIQSQIIGEGDFKQQQINVDTLDGALATHGLPKPDFIKIDIEGMEYQALLGMSKTINNYFPQLYIEIHGADELSKCKNINRIIWLLKSWGYAIWHIETQQDITTSNCLTAKEGHIYCKIPGIYHVYQEA